VKDVLKAHDRNQVQVFAYSSGTVKDWVTDEIRTACTFRDVSTLDDGTLAAQIRNDGIDVLVDLSGHTAGSRLTAFASRPAPVMVSWLGYFATTGLPYMDAVLLDEWHAPQGTEAQFVEPIQRLPSRFCYQPVPWAPAEVAAPAFERNCVITFGCFNNSAKLNDGVFNAWAQILAQVPESRLILKRRTFNDDAYRQKGTGLFRLALPGEADMRRQRFLKNFEALLQGDSLVIIRADSTRRTESTLMGRIRRRVRVPAL
jgi:predicted O-linked N-acetylglucosamine transferase (SPINDLY family)